MKRRDWVIQALKHQQGDQIPYHLEFTQQALEGMIEHTGDPNIQAYFDSCLHYGQYWGWPTELADKPGYFRDEFGVVWNRSGVDKDIGVVSNPQIDELPESRYQFPLADEERLRADCEELIRSRGDRFTMAGFGFVMFERSWSLMGMENVLTSMILYPEELEELYDRICAFYLRLVDIALEYDFDGVYFGDDWGQQKGLIMGPANWRRFIKPRMARLYQRVKEKGLFVIQHSCGDCLEILPDLIEIGLDCYQTLQPDVYDLPHVKKEFGRDLAFWGGISVQSDLVRCQPDEIRAITRETMKLLGSDGGYIVAPSHALTFDVPPENILAMWETFLS